MSVAFPQEHLRSPLRRGKLHLISQLRDLGFSGEIFLSRGNFIANYYSWYYAEGPESRSNIFHEKFRVLHQVIQRFCGFTVIFLQIWQGHDVHTFVSPVSPPAN